jgi:hypothetical protein
VPNQPEGPASLNPDLELIKAPPVVSAEPDKLSKEELEIQHKHLENVGFAQDIQARKKYAFRIFLLVLFWLLGVYAILIFEGFRLREFHLPDNVLLAAIGSTTANIIAILVIVVKYLFPDKRT